MKTKTSNFRPKITRTTNYLIPFHHHSLIVYRPADVSLSNPPIDHRICISDHWCFVLSGMFVRFYHDECSHDEVLRVQAFVGILVCNSWVAASFSAFCHYRDGNVRIVWIFSHFQPRNFWRNMEEMSMQSLSILDEIDCRYMSRKHRYHLMEI